MIRIGLISDTHGFLDPNILHHFADRDEIWHAGDFGSPEIIKQLERFKPLKGVYGNIDSPDISALYPEKLFFHCEGIPVFMQHIGGYPGRYAPGVKKHIVENGAKLFISGHSHILKIIYDKKLQCLHINPGAAGRAGWHLIRTIVKFEIDGKEILNCNIVELGPRGQ